MLSTSTTSTVSLAVVAEVVEQLCFWVDQINVHGREALDVGRELLDADLYCAGWEAVRTAEVARNAISRLEIERTVAALDAGREMERRLILNYTEAVVALRAHRKRAA